MPCISGPSYDDVVREARRIDDLANMLCTVCAILEVSGGKFPPHVAAWWRAHKAEDDRRRKQEEAQKEMERQRQEALSLLSEEQKLILGLK